MNALKAPLVVCPVCGKLHAPRDLVSGVVARPAVAKRIIADHPEWTTEQQICLSDLRHYQLAHLEDVLEAERGELSMLDREVLERIEKGETIAEDLSTDLESRIPIGGRVADRVASFGGSWTFIIIFFSILLFWIVLNSVLLIKKPFDPYPFILLNLVLSCLAAIQAPIIMMSQNRQETKDRARAEHDYQVNLKAELEVRMLHEKLDHLIVNQWQRLLDIQQIQTEMLDGLASRLD